MRTLLLLALIFASTLCAQAGNWQQEVATAPWDSAVGKCLVTFNNKLWLIGGSYNGDVWSSPDGVNWTQELASAPWAPRGGHAVVAFNNHLWVFGGNGSGGYKNDVWFSADGINWTLASTSPLWSPRVDHTVVVFNNRLWLIGGRKFATYNDVWSSHNGGTWVEETAAAPWAPMYRHAAAVFNNRIYVLGGGVTTKSKEVWSSSTGSTWKLETSAAPWGPRFNHAVTVFNDKLWVMGGGTGSVDLADAWTTTDGVSWNLEMAWSNWSRRSMLQAGVHNSKLWVMGGYDGSLLRDIWSCVEPPSTRLTLNASPGDSFFPPATNLVAMNLEAHAFLSANTLDSITFAYTGTAPSSEITQVSLFLDSNTNGGIDASDTTLGSGTLTGGSITFAGTPLAAPAPGARARLLLGVSTTTNIAQNKSLRFEVTGAGWSGGVDVTSYPLQGPELSYYGVAIRHYGATSVGSSGSVPFNFPAGSGRFQTAYSASELGVPTGTLITEVRVLGTVNPGIPEYGNLRLRIGHTSLAPDNLTANFDANCAAFETCLGPANYTPSAAPTPDGAWYVFTLTNPFVYNGSDGIVIDWSYDSRNGVGFLVGFDSGRDRVFVNGGGAGSASGSVENTGNLGLRITMFPPGSLAGLLVTRTLAGPVPSGTVDTVTGTGFGKATTLAYEALNVSTTSISFTGATPVSVVAGTNNPGVAVTLQPGSPLAPGGATTAFEIEVTPAVLGAWDALVTIASDDPNSPYTFTIGGVAGYPTLPLMEVWRNGAHVQSGASDVQAVPTALTFSLHYTIYNDGNDVLELTGSTGSEVIIFGESNCTVQANLGATTIAPQDSTTLTLLVTSLAQGPVTFAAMIPTNDPAANPYAWNYGGDTAPPPTASSSSSGGCVAESGADFAMLLLIALAACAGARTLRQRVSR